MIKSVKSLLKIFLLLFILSPSVSMAADPVQDPFYQQGVPMDSAPSMGEVDEHVDPFSGNMSLVHTDIHLPGNGGLDLDIMRIYDSSIWGRRDGTVSPDLIAWNERSPLGIGWKMHMGILMNPSGNGSGNRFLSDNPVLEMPDGSRHQFFRDKNNTSRFISKDYWLLTTVVASHEWLVTSTDGTKYTFKYNANEGYYTYDSSAVQVAQCTKIENAGGTAAINITYQTSTYNGYPYLTAITDSTGGRTVNFVYNETNHTLTQIKVGTTSAYLIHNYNYSTNGGVNLLTTVSPPIGNPWQYTYDSLHNLTQMVYPEGGTINYTYDDIFFDTGVVSVAFRVVTERQTSGNGIPLGTWTYNYGSGGGTGDLTIITGPDGITEHHKYEGWGSSGSNGSVWKIGLPIYKKIIQSGTTIYQEDYQWSKSDTYISNDDIGNAGWNGAGGWIYDSQIFNATLSSKTITQDGKAYTTNYGNYDYYGNAGLITETGDLSLTTNITYDTAIILINANIVRKPDVITVTGSSGTFTTNNDYWTTASKLGQLKQVNRYGVVTQYDYNSSGNLYSVKDANLNTTYYYWDKGRINKIVTPEYAINKSINADGTVNYEDNGRLDRTYFTYDDNLRLTKINPPLGNDTDYTYTYTSGGLRTRETKGSYYTDYNVDGFRRSVGTADSIGVSTTTSYKASGQKDYETSNVGDKTFFDYFGRVTRVLHKDNNDIDYSYVHSASNGALQVTITDEAGKSSYYYYKAYGSPGESILSKVRDALGNDTSYTFNTLGSLLTVTQGSKTRTFSYDTKNFLISETHPERGTINYNRDAVGNLASRSDSVGSVTYGYDGVNRLTSISGTDNVSFAYVGKDLRSSMSIPSLGISYNYYYDDNDRLDYRNYSLPGGSFNVNYAYDNNGNLTSILYPSGRNVTYAYNTNNQVTTVSGFGGNVNSIQYYTSGVNAGQLRSYTYSNGVTNTVTTTLNYNSRNLVTNISAGSALAVSYGYDSRGNTTSIGGDYSQSFTYDDLNRLLNFNGAWGGGSYSYDSLGNRTRKSGVTYTYDTSKNRLSSSGPGESYLYNGSGDVTSYTTGGQTHTLAYDDLHQLTSYSLGGNPLASFTYDGDGNRVTKISNGETTVYHYDENGNVLSKSDGAGTFLVDYIYLYGKLVAKVELGAAEYTVTPNPGPNGTISPLQPQSVAENGYIDFEITPAPGYGIANVTGCPGVLTGNIFKAGPITANCTLSATFVAKTSFDVYIIAGPGGLISPDVTQTVNTGGTVQYQINPYAGFSIKTARGCGGTLDYNTALSAYTYTTGQIYNDCTVEIDLINFPPLGVISHSSGWDYTVAVKGDGTLWGWGSNSKGQLGDGTTTDRLVPKQIGTRTDWMSVSAGDFHTLAIKKDGTLWAWGNNTSGELALDFTIIQIQTEPHQVGSETDWALVSAGSSHSVAIKKDGTLWAWGNNGYGQVGDGWSASNLIAPVKIGFDKSWAVVSAGFHSNLAITTDGNLWAWGYNTLGQLGDGTDEHKYSPVPVSLSGDWKSTSVNARHSLAVKTDGTLWAWGDNLYGQLGNGTIDQIGLILVPGQIGFEADWSSVSASNSYSLALKSDGTLWAWGDNRRGAIAGGIDEFILEPKRVAISAGWQTISAKRHHSTATKTDGTLWAWGDNSESQLGNDVLPQSTDPLVVGVKNDWKMVDSGCSQTVAIKNDGSLWAWGENSMGLVGDGTKIDRSHPVQIGYDIDWKTVSVGDKVTMVMKEDGSLWAWGDNGGGPLGVGDSISRLSPVPVGTETDWKMVSPGFGHTLAIKMDGTLWAWGNNASGQLGDGFTEPYKDIPKKIGLDADWKLVVAGPQHSMAIKMDGSLWTWGKNTSGQLGDGFTVDQGEPKKIGDNNWKAVAGGVGYTLALKNDGTLWAWGDNTYGQLGTGMPDSSLIPVQVDAATDWSALSAQLLHSLALKADNSLWAWGYNSNGQIGDGSTTNKDLPVKVGLAMDWSSVSAGCWNNAAIKADGSLRMWGDNRYGKLGDGTTWTIPSPVFVFGREDLPRTLTLAANAGGTTNPPASQVVAYGDPAAYQINSNQGYELSTVYGCDGNLTGDMYSMGEVSRDCTVNIVFGQTPTLTVAMDGTGSGSVTAYPRGINCGSDCSEVYRYGGTVTLSPIAEPGSIFTGWSGGVCDGMNPCEVSMINDAIVTAIFTDLRPAAPSNLVGEVVSANEIMLTWTDNSGDETGFRIERKTGAGGTYAEVGTVGIDVTSFNDLPLTTGETYFYRVVAFNAAGDSAYSNEASGVPVSLAVLYVDNDSTCTVGCGSQYNPFQTIQAAIDNAVDNDEVIVMAGNYVENVRVLKSINLTTTDNAIVTALNPAEPAITIIKSNVTVSGFTAKGGYGGIALWGAQSTGAVISNNIMEENQYGFGTLPSADPTGAVVSENVIRNNTIAGIGLAVGGDSVQIVGNEINNNGTHGIAFDPNYTGTNLIIRENSIGQNDKAITNAMPGTTIYNNFFIGNNVQITNSNAAWHNGEVAGGNYWSNHSGPDDNGDGFIDVPYGTDLYPLVNPYLFLYVDDNSSCTNSCGSANNPYLTIQEAVNNAVNGDTIIVMNGTYNENVSIAKPLTLKTIDGATIIASNSSVPTIEISSANVTIDGFVIKNGDAGVRLSGASTDCLIFGNVVENNLNTGIEFAAGANTSGTLINNNNIMHNGTYAIFLDSVGENVVVQGNVLEGHYYGVYFDINFVSSNFLITENNVQWNNFNIFDSIDGTVIYHNNFIGNAYQYTYGNAQWHNGAEGNYWWYSHSGPDDNGDGIIDVPYYNDLYPLVSPFVSP